MKTKIKMPDCRLFLVSLVFISIIGFAIHYVFAASFHASDYPDLCFDRYSQTDTNTVNVYAHNCASGETNTSDYNFDNPSATVTLIVTCNYTYGDWNACSPSGQKTRSVISPIPNNYTCSNSAAISQTCTYTTATATTTVPVDTTNPTATISVPVANATVSNIVPVTFGYSDNLAVNSIEIYVDGVKVSTILANAASGSTYYSWNTVYFSEGTHTVMVKVFDAAQNHGSDSRTVTVNNVSDTVVDTTFPVVNITAPTNGETVSGMKTVTATASDNIGVYQVKFYVDSINDSGFIVNGYLSSSVYSFNWDTTTKSDGSHIIYAKALDASGNASIASTTANVINNPASGNSVSSSQVIACTNECTSMGAKLCSSSTGGAANFVPGYQICGNYDSDDCYEWSGITSCASGQICSEGVCQTPQTCVTGAVNGCKVCNSWGSAWVDTDSKCASGQKCQNGVCIAACSNECSLSGIKKCSVVVSGAASSTSGSGYQICGDLNNDSCLEWSGITSCASGQICSEGVCQTPQTCVTGAVNGCKVCNSWGSAWVDTDSKCASGQKCQNGVCIAACSNECSLTGAKVCSGISRYKVCGNYDDDSCLEWSAIAECTSGKVCSDNSSASGVCIFASSTVPCASYTYDNWEACSSNNTQSRKIISKLPNNCTDASSAVISQSCVYMPCKNYAYTGWSVCNFSGKQTRQVITSEPAGCSGGEPPVLERDCPACEYNYSNWESCQITGTQNRKLISQFPENCLQKSLPQLEQSCQYQSDANSNQFVLGGSAGVVEQKKPCDYSYSAWGACVNKRQTRMLISASPENCDASIASELSQGCNADVQVLPVMSNDAPAAAPKSVLMPVPQEVINLNGRTSAEWQKYYFGVAGCQDAVTCAGDADPDKDGLNNNDEYRFGTHPKSPDTDRDGVVDADEIQKGRDPLVVGLATSSDAIIYESPKNNGQELKDNYQITGIEYATTTQELIIKGKGLPQSYVSIYIYSEEPVILTVKTDSEGNWIHTIDKPQDGTHEVYLVVNENSGKVVAKSPPLPFVQTAEAATVIYPSNPINMEKAPAPAKTRLAEGYIIFFATGIGGMVLALIVIGLARNMGQKKEQ